MMKQAIWLAALLAAVAVVCGYLTDFEGDDAQAVAAPPLSLEGFLDEKLPEAPKEKEELKVDNQACHVCHGNYQEEPLALEHAKEGVGCIDCHGESLDHRDDEDNITPPETMYALEDIDKMCGKCHDMHDASGRKVIQRWQERCPEKSDPEKIVCTDCHFQHRLRFRTVWWDKKTGELVIRKEGQRTKPADAPGTSQ